MDDLAHGVDIVPIARIEQMLATHGDRFIERVFTSRERADAERVSRGRVERYAVRFAAKEAVFKALGTGLSGGITWQDVDVHRSGNGAPMLTVHGVAARKADELGLQIWRLSMSHAGGMAMASVVATGIQGSDA